MTAVVAEHQLYRAGEILFGSELRLSREFLEYLQPAGVKSAFRRRARETHPDLVAPGDQVAQRRHALLFHDVKQAYDQLLAYLDAREKGYRLPCGPGTRPAPPRPASTAQTSRTAGATTNGKRYNGAGAGNGRTRTNGCRYNGGGNSWQQRMERRYQGPMPQRPLLFGHFLYYAGVISWRQVIQALVWQRQQRPRIGELGRRLGWLSDADIHRVLESRLPLRPFGEEAVRLGLLDEGRLRILVWQQRRLQRRFGDYFVEHAILSGPQIEILAARHRQHNRQCSRLRQGGAC